MIGGSENLCFGSSHLSAAYWLGRPFRPEKNSIHDFDGPVVRRPPARERPWSEVFAALETFKLKSESLERSRGELVCAHNFFTEVILSFPHSNT